MPWLPWAGALILSAGVIPGAWTAPILSEVMSDNRTTLTDEDGDYSDWIEIYNPGDAAIELEGHFLTDDPEDLERWEFPAAQIPPDGFLIVFASGKDRAVSGLELHTSFGLNRDGEWLALVDPDGSAILDSIDPLPPLDGDVSYGVVSNGEESTLEILDAPSPGEPNVANIVRFSEPGRTFVEPFLLEMTTPSGEPIRYSTNGAKPSLFNGQTYTGPVTISNTSLVVAQAGNGAVFTEVYLQVEAGMQSFSSDIPVVLVSSRQGSFNQTQFKEMAIGFFEPGAESGRTEVVGPAQLATRGGMRVRGETSASFPKQPYRLEFWEAKAGAEDVDRVLSPLGLPRESDFILNARYEFDRTLMRNDYIFELSRQIGQYAARTRFVELYVSTDNDPIGSDDYRGVYSFGENLKRDGARVDLQSLPVEAAAPPEITGGYLFKKDKDDPGTWNFSGGGEPLQMVYPLEEQRAERAHQQTWLAEHLDALRQSTLSSVPETGYHNYIDERAWIDHHLLNVLMLNVDALRLSAYFYKDREGLVVAGPVWDFDRSAGSTDGRSAVAELWRGQGGDSGTHFFKRDLGTPVWWENLFNLRDFQQAWADRWRKLRQGPFSVEHLHALADQMAAEINEAQARNFQRWPGAPPRSAGAMRYTELSGFAGEVDNLKGWLQARVEWIDGQLIQTPVLTPGGGVHPRETTVRMAGGGSIFNPDEIWFTTDGTDPRGAGGEPSDEATLYAGSAPPVLTRSTTIMARKKDDNYRQPLNGPDQQWSAPVRTRYFVGAEPASPSNLVVSEIMYNPAGLSPEEQNAGFVDGDQFEFIELHNTGQEPVDLAGVRFDAGVNFGFSDAEEILIPPGGFLLLVADPEAFAARYGSGIAYHGAYTGRLQNGGETIRLLTHGGDLLLSFRYDDEEGWPQEADGDGHSLERAGDGSHPDPADPEHWRASAVVGGTPGRGPGEEPVETGYALWRTEVFTPEQLLDQELSGDQADPEGDLLVTLMEYALGGLPFVNDTARLPSAGSIDIEGQAYLTLTFQRPQALPDIDYSGAASNDLSESAAEEVMIEHSVTDNGDGSETVVLRDPQAILGDAQRFAWLRVSHRPQVVP
ncbi:MAG TPA: CotH kinase family protein [Verrucomicrobiales bacterium]|nr:CotH kinase family protein [Verrucomicrobiales bacterium]